MTEKVERNQHPWLMLAIIYFAAFTAPLNMFKASAVAPALMMAFGFDASGVGYLMSAYTLVGIALALPAGAIARKVGYKQTALLALCVALVGTLIGCFAQTYETLLISRVFEGVGMCMMGVTGVSLVCGYFEIERRGLAVGIFATYMALAACLGNIVLAMIGDAFGYLYVWYFGAALSILAIVLVALFLKNPELPEEEANEPRVNMFKIIAEHKKLWVLCIIMLIENFVVVGVFNNFASTYLTAKFGISMTQASFVAAVAAVFSCITTILFGKLSDHFKTRKVFLLIGIVGGLISTLLYYYTGSFVFIVFLTMLNGVAGGSIAGLCQTIGPEILEKTEYAPVSQSFLSFGQNIGQFVGSAAFGVAATSIGWTMAGWVILVPLFVVALILALVLKIK